jgi:hypothetical protein
MYTGQVAVISNKATWRSDTVELVDEADGTTTDLTTVSPLDIVVTIKNADGCTLATASIENGKVTVPGPGFQWQFEDTDLSNLCAGTYRLGIKVTIDDFINDLIDGTIAVLEGN